MERRFGIKHGKLETAKEMMKNNINIEIIKKCTGLGIKELEKMLAK